MKKELREINGEKKNVIVSSLGEIVISGVNVKDYQKKDGTWTKLRQARTNYGIVTISESMYDSIKSGKLPDDNKLYITVNYLGIQGTGASAFDDI